MPLISPHIAYSYKGGGISTGAAEAIAANLGRVRQMNNLSNLRMDGFMSSSIGYDYDWQQDRYEDYKGREVSFDVAMATMAGDVKWHITGSQAQKLIDIVQERHKDGFNLYGVGAFGRLSIVSSDEEGYIGDVELYPNSGIDFTNPDAARFMTIAEVGTDNLSENLLFGNHAGISLYKK
ncbi:MAG: hypothetical protein K9J27_11520 [Bacteroidales bacterium]|nr:hypothetical protein [Bacteroidales bacterium]MCF8334051.1 hypothetical protein [Bacteroidales bacterium]